MDIIFVNMKARYYCEEVLAILFNIVEEIKKNKNSAFTNEEVHSISNEFFNLITLKTADLKTDQYYNDTNFISLFQLALVATIDDIFLTLAWSGRQFWASYVIETRFFDSRAAGDIFFTNCSKIISSKDAKSTELAAIYYLCLTAGFRGRYFDVEYAADLNTYRTDLYNRFNSAETAVPDFAAPALLPSGYIPNESKTVLDKKNSFFNMLLLLNLIVLILFVAASYFVFLKDKRFIFLNL